MESVGSSKCSLLEEIHQLAKARVLKGIVSIAEETKIGLHYLSAIEEGKLDKLPGGVYLFGSTPTGSIKSRLET